MFKNYQLNIIMKIKKTSKNDCERYQNFSMEEKEKKQQYDHERCKNLSEKEKKKLVKNRKKIIE